MTTFQIYAKRSLQMVIDTWPKHALPGMESIAKEEIEDYLKAAADAEGMPEAELTEPIAIYRRMARQKMREGFEWFTKLGKVLLLIEAESGLSYVKSYAATHLNDMEWQDCALAMTAAREALE